jgi:hypothetical protein
LILGAVVTLGIWATERLFYWLWAEQTPRFFDWIPVKWLFDASEFGVMIVFVVFGILEAYQKMKR